MSHTGRIDIRAIALEPIHHGAGNDGNTVTLRRQAVLMPDGTVDYVPFVSGNSIRHMLRDAGVRFALEAMAVPDGSLSKGVVDLLFSGGSLGGKASLTLAKARRVAELFPILAVLGYSAGTRITGGRLEVGNLHLVCEQNRFRRPDLVDAQHPRYLVDAGAHVGSEFGMRHDAARISHAASYLAIEDKSRVELVADKGKGKTKEKKDSDSTQMIYDWEVILPGSEMTGAIVYRALKEGELSALASALSHACDGVHTDGGYLYQVGAKRGTGHGRMSWRFSGLTRPVATPAMTPTDVLLPAIATDASERITAYKAHLAEHRADILAELEELAA